MNYQLAQLNIARLQAPIDSPQLKDFVDNLDRINALAESAPGFVWRLMDDVRHPSAISIFDEDCIVNMSVWESIEVLRQYVYFTAHKDIMRRKQEWFTTMSEAHQVLWWVPAGYRPTKLEARQRLDRLRQSGPSADAFHFKQVFAPPSD